MPGRGRPRQFDRTAALRTAMELFWTHGYAGTSVSLLSNAIGITSTSLYAAFGSKEAIFREAVELYNTNGTTSPTDNALTAPSARQAVESMLRDNAEAYLDPSTPPGCMVVLSGLNLPPGEERISHHLTKYRGEVYDKVLHRLEQGVADGDLPPKADTTTMASYYVTVLHGLSIQARDGCTRATAHAVIDGAMLAWEGLAHGRHDIGE